MESVQSSEGKESEFCRSRRSADALALGALAALVTGFVHGMVDNGFFLPDLAVLTWFAIALIERSSR